jgi:short-subunit dehydrogenase
MEADVRSIQSEVAVITGASSGIGAELARRLADRGVRLGLTARRADRLEQLAAEIQARGGTAAVAPADAADPASTRAAIVHLARQLGPVELLIANAGVGLSAPASQFSAEAFEQMVRVNLLGAAVAIEVVLPGMLERRRGHIVGVSSLAGWRGLPQTAGYSATKAGLSTLLEGLRVELRLKGVDVTVVHPGYVRTPMTEGSGNWQPFLLEVGPAAERILRGIAARRREINFPWQTALLMDLVRRLPGPVYDRLAGAILVPRERPAQ